MQMKLIYLQTKYFMTANVSSMQKMIKWVKWTYVIKEEVQGVILAMVGGVVMHRRRDSGQPGSSTAPPARSPASFMLTQEMGIRDGTEGVHVVWHSNVGSVLL